MTFEEIVKYRRSTRLYSDAPINSDRVKNCIELATLAPNSSNMQLWEFYHVTDIGKIKALSKACLDQGAATTAQQMVVFVTRRDLYKKRAKTMMALETQNVLNNSPKEKQKARLERWKIYYGKVIPLLYAQFFGLLGFVRKIMVTIIGFFRPIFHEVSESDTRVVVHKTCALAAQTFMLAMANEGYDTCPMEGFDSKMVKKLLNLPHGAEINMIVSCGIRDEKGIWGERMRVPFDTIYHRL